MSPRRRTEWLWARFESWLSGLSATSSPALFGGFLLWFVSWSVLASLAARAVVQPASRPELEAAAGRLIPAVGVLFALLTAFVITNQWNRSRTAEQIVGGEADACVRLALASQSPGIDGARARGLLVRYLRSLLHDEWDTLRHEQAGSSVTADALSRLEQEVRADATGAHVSTAITADLLAAAEGVAVARRDRLNLAGHGLPAPLFLLVFVSGVVLCLNAISLAITVDDWVVIIIGGLIVLIALDLALVVAISDPYRGPMSVTATPIERVLNDLERGRFGSLPTLPNAAGS